MKEVTIKNSGATFTPTELADFLSGKILSELKIKNQKSYTILDPACGEGELLLSLAKKLKLQNSKVQINLKGLSLIHI